MERLQKLFRYEQTSGLLMIAAMVLALVTVNSPFAPIYNIVHHTPVHIRFGSLVIDEPLVHWINEGLMVIFFLLVGLEIKRQLLEGQLSTFKSAILPAFAAIGGILLPAAIYIAFNAADPIAIRGWAIPTATDIVLALGVLSLIGSRVPASLKIFLTALAIFDDIVAVLIIGLFYGEELLIVPLGLAGASVGGLVLLNLFGLYRLLPVVAISLVLWVALLDSGIEASLAGILIAITVPMRISGLQSYSPLRKTERRLHPWGVLFVVPVFAFFNAGIAISSDATATLWTSVPLGIVAGLFIGKQIGIVGATWLAVRIGIGELPSGVTWLQIYGVAVLAGIGFTMSLFVASLAFADLALLSASKLAILTGSCLSATFGVYVIYYSTKSSSKQIAV